MGNQARKTGSDTVFATEHGGKGVRPRFARLTVAVAYDMDACRTPTGVTRHALAQVENLRARPEIDLRLVSGRISEPDGRAYWGGLGDVARREMPLSMKWALRYWRLAPRPSVDGWTGEVDWVYSPAEYGVRTKRASLAVTSHDIRQDLEYGGARRKARLERVFGRADLVLSVSEYNTERLLEAFPFCRNRTALVPNGADDLFFEAAEEWERATIRARLGVPSGMPYLLSVANFQGRKNLDRLIRAVGRLREVGAGEMALVLVGSGDDEQARGLRETAASVGPRAVIAFPGYLQGPGLRAAYAEARALVFPSLCESFGIPAVEAMAQGCPMALRDSSALPEVAGEAGWYFDPEDEEAIAGAVRSLLEDSEGRRERVERGLEQAGRFRWGRSGDRLVEALRGFSRG